MAQMAVNKNIHSAVVDQNGNPVIGLSAEGVETLTIYNAEEKTTTSAPAAWRDDNAVKKLISLKDQYKPLFQSKTLKTAEIWEMIAAELVATNSLWMYTGVQCENKFKDGRKAYNAIKDHNNISGNEPRRCKFFEEFEAILGDKPGVKPVATASSMKRPAAEVEVADENIDDIDELLSSSSTSAETSSSESSGKSKKKAKIEEQLAKFTEELQEDKKNRERRHQENLQRMDMAREMYKEMMNTLIDKL